MYRGASVAAVVSTLSPPRWHRLEALRSHPGGGQLGVTEARN